MFLKLRYTDSAFYHRVVWLNLFKWIAIDLLCVHLLPFSWFLRSLQPFPVPENKTGPITIDFLTKRLLALGAVQTGGFLVDCETFNSNASLGKLSFWYFCMIVVILWVLQQQCYAKINLCRPYVEVRDVVCFCLFSFEHQPQLSNVSE